MHPHLLVHCVDHDRPYRNDWIILSNALRMLPQSHFRSIVVSCPIQIDEIHRWSRWHRSKQKWQRCCPCISSGDSGNWTRVSRTRRLVWISSTLDWRSCWQVTSNRPNSGSERISRRRLNRFNGRQHSETEFHYLLAVAVQLRSGGDEASSSDRSLRFLGTGSSEKGWTPRLLHPEIMFLTDNQLFVRLCVNDDVVDRRGWFIFYGCL